MDHADYHQSKIKSGLARSHNRGANITMRLNTLCPQVLDNEGRKSVQKRTGFARTVNPAKGTAHTTLRYYTLTAKAARSHWFNSRRGASDLRCPANSNPRAHLLKRLYFALHLHAQNLLHWRPPRDAANNHEHALDLANYTLPVVGRKGARRGD